MALTYKTVITNAIKGFNDIQSKLATLTDLGISPVSSSTTSGITTVSNSITPANMVDAIGRVATIKKPDGSFISGRVTYRGDASSTVNPEVSQNGATITASYSKSLVGAGYYTGGTISGSVTYTIPSGSVTITSSVSQSTFDGSSTTALSTDILLSSAPTSYYKVVMTPGSEKSVSAGYVTNSDVSLNSGLTVTKYIKKGSVSSSVSGNNPTVTPSVAITKAADYGFVTTAPSGTDGTNFLTINPGGSSNTQTFTSSMSFTAGYIKSKGTEGTKSVTASIAAGTNYYVPIVSVTHAGGGASIKSSSTSATASGLTITDTDTDPGSGIYISTSGSATPKRAAVTYTNAKGVIAAHSGTTALSAADGSATTLTGNKYYVTEVSVPSGKTLSKVTNAGTITTLTGTGTIGTQSGTQTVTSNTGTITTTTNNGTVTVTTNAASKNVNIGTNNGNINITNASTGTVNYEDWKIYYNNSNKTIEFLFTE